VDRADLRSEDARPFPDRVSHRRGESARGRVSAAILGPPRRVLQRGVIEKFALHLGGDTRHQARTKQGLDPKLLRYPQIECLTLLGFFWLSSSSRIDIRRLSGALGRAHLLRGLA
jgi:hypothetical protein